MLRAYTTAWAFLFELKKCTIGRFASNLESFKSLVCNNQLLFFTLDKFKIFKAVYYRESLLQFFNNYSIPILEAFNLKTENLIVTEFPQEWKLVK